MKYPFWKYHGTGNDFVIFNNLDLKLSHNPELAREMCDRHFGIGSDGLIIIENAKGFDFKMVFYNPDGSQSFCGNGSRCAVRFAKDQGMINSSQTYFLSTDGPHHASIDPTNVNIEMTKAEIRQAEISEDALLVNRCIFVNTGSPHLILFIDRSLNLADLDVKHFGSKIRYSPAYKSSGVNVNFVGMDAENVISLRTYERGVEDETLSCGTGITAAAIAYHALFSKNHGDHLIRVNAMGGKLEVKFSHSQEQYSNIQLCGPARFVFSGEIEI